MKAIISFCNKVRHNEKGESNPFIIITVVLVVLLIAAAGGFVWSYAQMVDYKDNVAVKVNNAVDAANKKQAEKDQQKFQEELKKPNLSYQGPSDLGSVRFEYPKTWSVYVAESVGKLEVFMNPAIVPKVAAGVTPYALRVEVTPEDYASVIENYSSKLEDEDSKVTASTITIGKSEGFSGYKGMRFDGQLTDTVNGSIVIFKVRDKVLKVSVDSKDFMADFNDTVLKTLQFEP